MLFSDIQNCWDELWQAFIETVHPKYPSDATPEIKKDLDKDKEKVFEKTLDKLCQKIGVNKKTANSNVAFDGKLLLENAILEKTAEKIQLAHLSIFHHLSIKSFYFGSSPTLVNPYRTAFFDIKITHEALSAKDLKNLCVEEKTKNGSSLKLGVSLKKLKSVGAVFSGSCSENLLEKVGLNSQEGQALAQAVVGAFLGETPKLIHALSLEVGQSFHPSSFNLENAKVDLNYAKFKIEDFLEEALYGKTLGPTTKTRQNSHTSILIAYLNTKGNPVLHLSGKNHLGKFLGLGAVLDTPSASRHGSFLDGKDYKIHGIENEEFHVKIPLQIRFNSNEAEILCVSKPSKSQKT